MADTNVQEAIVEVGKWVLMVVIGAAAVMAVLGGNLTTFVSTIL